MGFDVTPTSQPDWTNNLDSLTTGINALRPGGGTALFDAVYIACHDKLLDAARGQEPVRKAMVLISDGDDNQSHAYPDDAIKDMPARFDHHLRHQHQYQPQPRQWRRYPAEDRRCHRWPRLFSQAFLEEMPVSFQDIQDELRSQYAIIYKPADFKNEERFGLSIFFVSTAATWSAPARVISPPRDKRPVLGVFAVPPLEPPPPRREKSMFVRA